MDGQIQWLLVGGPAHGMTVHARNGDNVLIALPTGAVVRYDGCTRMEDFMAYRIGRMDPTPGQEAQISNLIRMTGLKPVSGKPRLED